MRRGEKITFLVGNSPSEDSLLVLHLQECFARVLEEARLDKNLLQLSACRDSDLVAALRQNVGSQHVFVDETFYTAATLNYLRGLEEANMSKCLWIAFRPDEKPAHVEGARRLQKVFRNQPNIARYLKMVQDAKTEVDINNPPVAIIVYQR